MLKEAKLILAPLVLAIFLSVALLPLLRFINRFIKSNFWSVFTLISFNSLVVGGLGLVIYSQLQDFEQNSKSLYSNIETSFKQLEEKLENTTHFDAGDIEDLIEDNQEKIIDSGSETAILLVDNVSNLLLYLATIPLYTFFLLFYRREINSKLQAVLSSIHIRYKQLAGEFSSLIQDYLKGIMIVIFILGVLNSLGLWALDVPYAFLLGFLVAAFSIVPYIGMIVGGSLVLIISYATQGSLPTLGLITALFAVIQFVEGNFITPYVVGNKVNINSFVAILALLVGSQLWGIAGMILAIPTTAAISIFTNQLQDKVYFKPS
jgi:predicted PurR-regulated permease PerM